MSGSSGIGAVCGLFLGVCACVAVTPPSGAGEAPVFQPAARAVSTWRQEAAAGLAVDGETADRLKGDGPPPSVARCVKLNNYWCIKRAGWNGEIAADGEGHVAFASAEDGAAVAALLLKRYYVDFGRHTALAIVSHWAPARCGGPASVTGGRRVAAKNAGRFAGTLRARWLASHPRGFVTALPGRRNIVKRSVVADRARRIMPVPVIAAGLAGLSHAARPITLDALMVTSANAPASRSMLGLPNRRANVGAATGFAGCTGDSARLATYAAKAASGLDVGKDGDLNLFATDGTPTKNLSRMMANMARVEIGPLGADAGLIERGIAAAFRPGRNAEK